MRCTTVCIEEWTPSDELFEKLVGLLDEAARTRIHAFKFRRDALAHLVGRLLPIWEVCSRYKDKCLLSVKQVTEAKGRPYLIDAAQETALDYDFNISHDGDAVVMVSHFAPGNIKLGIDIMREALPVGIPDIPEFAATIDDMLSENEKELLNQAHVYEKLGLLLRFWTTKEAVSKALGQGLAFPYAELDSTKLHGWKSHMVQDHQCQTKDFACNLGSKKYLICVACLGIDGTNCALPAQVDLVSVEMLIKDMLALQGGASMSPST